MSEVISETVCVKPPETNPTATVGSSSTQANAGETQPRRKLRIVRPGQQSSPESSAPQKPQRTEASSETQSKTRPSRNQRKKKPNATATSGETAPNPKEQTKSDTSAQAASPSAVDGTTEPSHNQKRRRNRKPAAAAKPDPSLEGQPVNPSDSKKPVKAQTKPEVQPAKPPVIVQPKSVPVQPSFQPKTDDVRTDKETVDEELSFLKKTYSSRIHDIPIPNEDTIAAVHVSLLMARDFPFDINGNALEVDLFFPKKYPMALCSITVCNEEIPKSLREKMNATLAKRILVYKGNGAMASGLLRWLKNQAEKMMVDKEITENRLSGITLVVPNATHGKTMGIIEAIHHSKPIEIEEDLSGVVDGADQIVMIKKPGDKTSSDGIDTSIVSMVVPESSKVGEESKEKEENDEDEQEDEDEDEDENEAEQQETVEEPKKKNGPAFPTGTAHKGIQLRAEGLVMKNVGIMTCMKLSLVYACVRCNQQDLTILSPGETHSDTCGRCKSPYTIGFRPEPVHEASDIIGYIDKNGVTPVEIRHCVFTGSCLGCNADILDITLTAGAPLIDNCHECNERYELLFTRVSMKRIVSPEDAAAAAAAHKATAKKKKDPREAGIHVGSPLPANGTCKHFKHSYRWLRFPCCGRAWPCDQCHDENSDHTAEWAQRMICGFCSKEQPFSQKGCVNCGSSMTTISKSHWEGGRGCRDKVKMARRDSKKFAGMNKTVSRAAAAAKKK